jgi:hypothetical protein
MQDAHYGTMSNPIMQQGQCVTNCNVDTFFIQYRKTRKSSDQYDDNFIFSHAGDSEGYYIVMPREFCFRLPMKTDPTIGRSSAMSSIGMVPKIFTSLNNFPITCTKDRDLFKQVKTTIENKTCGNHKDCLIRLLKELVARSIVFMGVPLTRVDPSANMSTGVSVAVSGTLTVYNTGKQNIDIGQKVAWDIPDVMTHSEIKIRGEPKGKRFIETVPVSENALLTPSSNIHFDPVKTLNALKNCSISYEKSCIYDEILKHFINLSEPNIQELANALSMVGGIRSRIIGTALTASGPGGSFDILLQI